MQVFRDHVRAEAQTCWRTIVALSPGAILLGISFNTLDTFSLGSLIFPKPSQHGDAFASLQPQAISLFIMSTIVSQFALTMGGSRLPGVLGSMLIEILPFLRAIASAIQSKLGHDHPGVLPTTAVAYPITSLLLGALFLIVGTLRCGSLAGFFPPPVLTGVIRAVGVSMCVSGLEVTLPSSHPPLSIGTASSSLFGTTHLPLLASSLLPAAFLCFSVTSQHVKKWTHGSSKHPLYIPIFCFVVGTAFWLVAGIRVGVSEKSLESLASTGWLFEVQKPRPGFSIGTGWNYWRLFDFSKVEWHALSAGFENYFLLLGIGTLVLAVFLQATASMLHVPGVDLDYEIRLHGYSNIVAGAFGALSGALVYANTRFHCQAGGRHADAFVVALCTVALLFVAPRLLPYFPTILAAVMVLFLGMQLIIEAAWESSKELMWDEWVTAVGTLLACSSLGFAPGIGIGLGIVAILSFCLRLADKRRSLIRPCTSDPHISKRRCSKLAMRFSRRIHKFRATTLSSSNSEHPEIVDAEQAEMHDRIASLALRQSPEILKLDRNSRFEMVAFGESAKSRAANNSTRAPAQLVVDLSDVRHMDTEVTKFVVRCLCAPYLVKVISHENEHIQADLARIGLQQSNVAQNDVLNGLGSMGDNVVVRSHGQSAGLSTLEHEVYALRFTGHAYAPSQNNLTLETPSDLRTTLTNSLMRVLPWPDMRIVERMSRLGLAVRRVNEGESLACGPYPVRSMFFVLQGLVVLRRTHALETASPLRRASVQKVVRSQIARFARAAGLKNTNSAGTSGENALQDESRLLPGDVYGVREDRLRCAYAAEGPCWVVEVDLRDNCAMAWAEHTAGLHSDARLPVGEPIEESPLSDGDMHEKLHEGHDKSRA